MGSTAVREAGLLGLLGTVTGGTVALMLMGAMVVLSDDGSIPTAVVSTWQGRVDAQHDELMAAIPGIQGLYIDYEADELVLDIYVESGTYTGNFGTIAEEITGVPVRVEMLEGPLGDLPLKLR
jgi:hypothetical protein